MSRSEDLFAEAVRLMPGGVSSPVRAFGAVGGTPRFIASGEGAWIEDVDGNRAVDLVLSWGPLLIGHAHPEVVRVLRETLERGTTFGAPTEVELRLAERVIATVPSVEMIRFVSSGTEATMSAIRLARGHTGRSGIIKFAGCYHGHADPLLAAAGSGVATFALPDSPGVPAAAVGDTLVAPFNALDVVREIFARRGEEIAAVIVEPVAGNMGVVPPADGFLEGLRAVTSQHGALLIFDEVMTGWRAHPGGAQTRYGVMPDLTCLGKVLGGGLPAAAYGGTREVMLGVAPVGPVYQAGTLSGNPLAMAAGLATLDTIAGDGVWERAARWAEHAAALLVAEAARQGIPITVHRVGTMFTPFFGPGPIRDFDEVRLTDRDAHARFFHALLAHGVSTPPSAFEAWFTSTEHAERELDVFEAALTPAFQAATG